MRDPEPGQTWGILGGTFDPIHIGHVHLAHEIKVALKLDWIMLIPSARHPLDKQPTAEFSDRIAMAEAVSAAYDWLIVSDIEKRLSLSGFTLDTVRALKTENPDVDLCFIGGDDLVSQLGNWHNPEILLEEVKFVVGTRKGSRQDSPFNSKITFIETPVVSISSTEVRKLLKYDRDGDRLKELIDPRVMSYIVQKRLYQ